jgi:CO/xanthine dehydrogenase FAD-binding subunit
MLQAHANEKTYVLAGGTDLIPRMRADVIAADYLVDITGLGLNKITESGVNIIIGATCTYKQIHTNSIVCEYLPALASATKSVGAVQTRGIATMGGNVCSAVPCLDSAPSLLIYEAQVKLVSAEGERIVPITEFFKGPRKTELQKCEILSEFIFKKPSTEFGACFIKVGRRNALTLAIVNAAFGCDVKDGKIFNARGSIGACAATPVRLTAVEEYLNGKDLNSIDFDILDGLVKGAIKPISDIRASAEYRLDLAAALVRKEVKAVLGGAE